MERCVRCRLLVAHAGAGWRPAEPPEARRVAVFDALASAPVPPEDQSGSERLQRARAALRAAGLSDGEALEREARAGRRAADGRWPEEAPALPKGWLELERDTTRGGTYRDAPAGGRGVRFVSRRLTSTELSVFSGFGVALMAVPAFIGSFVGDPVAIGVVGTAAVGAGALCVASALHGRLVALEIDVTPDAVVRRLRGPLRVREERAPREAIGAVRVVRHATTETFRVVVDRPTGEPLRLWTAGRAEAFAFAAALERALGLTRPLPPPRLRVEVGSAASDAPAGATGVEATGVEAAELEEPAP